MKIWDNLKWRASLWGGPLGVQIGQRKLDVRLMLETEKRAQASNEIVLHHVDFKLTRIANSFPNRRCNGRLEASLVAQRPSRLGMSPDFHVAFESKELKYGLLLATTPTTITIEQ